MDDDDDDDNIMTNKDRADSRQQTVFEIIERYTVSQNYSTIAVLSAVSLAERSVLSISLQRDLTYMDIKLT